MTKTGRRPDQPDDGALVDLFAAIATRDQAVAERMLARMPGLASSPLQIGATRQVSQAYFLTPIHHHVYGGDTALHVAAAAHHQGLARSLIARGAEVRARNRRGAEPLHYAADGGPATDSRDEKARRDLTSYLIDVGADPNAFDKSGVAPLHRAVRSRSSAVVTVLLDRGADPLLMNKTGSTPLHLAVQNTGKSNSGTEAAKEEQGRIIGLLLAHGARPTDADGKGKTVEAAATSDWVVQLLHNSRPV